MSPKAKQNQGFASMGNPRRNTDYADYHNDVSCGRCDKNVPSGTAHIVVDYRWAGGHQLFCPGCCPCRRKPESVRPFR